jgi:hypothetical protein
MFKNVEDDQRMQRIVRHMKITLNKKVPETYLQRITRAEALFYYHVVYNPQTQELCNFTKPNTSNEYQAISAEEDLWDSMGFLSHDRDHQTSGKENVGILQHGNLSYHTLGTMRGPAITPQELSNLGYLKIKDIIKSSRPSVETREYCSGLVSLKDSAAIPPKFPWDTVSVYERANQPKKSSNSLSGAKSPSSYLWACRRQLMSHFQELQGQKPVSPQLLTSQANPAPTGDSSKGNQAGHKAASSASAASANGFDRFVCKDSAFSLVSSSFSGRSITSSRRL